MMNEGDDFDGLADEMAVEGAALGVVRSAGATDAPVDIMVPVAHGNVYAPRDDTSPVDVAGPVASGMVYATRDDAAPVGVAAPAASGMVYAIRDDAILATAISPTIGATPQAPATQGRVYSVSITAPETATAQTIPATVVAPAAGSPSASNTSAAAATPADKAAVEALLMDTMVASQPNRIDLPKIPLVPITPVAPPAPPVAPPAPVPVNITVQLTAGAPVGTPFPEATAGPVSGQNGLVRLNFFDGRMLTADALRREQRYWDARARMVAEPMGAGLVWGLGLELPGLRHAGVTSPIGAGDGGLLLDSPAVLHAGLAFDAAGRPIAVGADFPFSFRALLRGAGEAPAEVVAGGTAFSPCVCLVRAPRRATGSALQTGAYLLVITPEETPEGSAKIYGTSCAAPPGCAAEGWRGGFGLSLARLPVDVPRGVQTAWALRGLLSAWYFDTFERSLAQRWTGQGPLSASEAQRWTGPGPLSASEPAHTGAPVASAVPLALLYVEPAGGVLLVDVHIPRRAVLETAATSRSRSAVGAATGASVVARRLQFQAMLEDSLGRQSMDSGGGSLLNRGFVHLPPAGFLPVLPDASAQDPIAAARSVLQQAAAFFAGTNVVIAEDIAIHDDLVLSELDAAAELDPIRLRADPGSADGGTALDQVLWQPALRRFDAPLRARNASAEQLVRRELELVRLVAPLRGADGGWPHTGAATPHGFVLFVRQPVSLSIGLSPPPRPIVVIRSPDPEMVPVRVRIDGPAPTQILWRGTDVRFYWTTEGVQSVGQQSARLTSRIRVNQPFSGPIVKDWSQDIPVDASGQSALWTVTDTWFVDPVTLTVRAIDLKGAETLGIASWKAGVRSIPLTRPTMGTTLEKHTPVELAWTCTDGWSPNSIRIVARCTYQVITGYRNPGSSNPPRFPTDPIYADRTVILDVATLPGDARQTRWTLPAEATDFGNVEFVITAFTDGTPNVTSTSLPIAYRNSPR